MASASQSPLPSNIPVGPTSRLRTLFRTSKRVALFGVCFGAGLGFVAFLVGFSVYEYENRTTPVHSWNTIELSNVGIKATLKTQARDGSIHYQLKVLPASEKFNNAFDQVARSANLESAFTAVFYDGDGFERCRGEMRDVTRVMNESDAISEIDGNGSFLGCSVSEYTDSTRWNLTYQFPTLKSHNPQDTPTIEGPREKYKSRNNGGSTQPENVTGEDVLTGASYDGRLETEAGHSFQVSRQAEIQTTWGWLASQHIKYECKAGVCLVRNVDNEQAVHARMSR